MFDELYVLIEPLEIVFAMAFSFCMKTNMEVLICDLNLCYMYTLSHFIHNGICLLYG